MALSPEQLAVWDVMAVHVPEPSSGQTPEQAVNLGVTSFLWACDWDGLEPLPSVADVLAEFRRRGASVLPDRAFLERVLSDETTRWAVAAGSYGPPDHRAEVARLRER